jgi:UPF0755 protein
MVFTDSTEVPAFPGTGEVPTYGGLAGPDRGAPGEPLGGWPDDDLAEDGYGDDAYLDDDYDDYDTLAADDDLPKRRGCRNAVVALAVLTVMALVAGWFAWSWVQGKIDPSGGPGEEVLVEIPEGTTTAGIGDILADEGVISDATVWDWYTKLRDVPTIQAGSYRLRLDSSFSEAIDALAEDPLPPHSRLVTVPDGLTQAQIAERLADPDKGVPGFTVEGVQAALADPSVRSPILPADQPLLEGTLFPETYAVEDDVTELEVIQTMVAQFNDVTAEVGLEGGAAALGLTPYEVIIVASMIEREAGIAEDGPKVARVIYNRMADGEALDIDATSCYPTGEFPCQVDEAIAAESPYDTRTKVGLPPTPIASPGQASIEAALAPAEGDWRWYVVDADANDGSSFFTNDYDEFLAAKERCADAGLGCG